METETIDAFGANIGRVSELVDLQSSANGAGLEILAVPIAIFLTFGVAVCFFLAQKNKRELEKTQEICLSLRNDLQIAASSAIGMGQRIISLEKKLDGSVTSRSTVKSSEEMNHNESKVRSSNRSASKTGVGSFAETLKQEAGEQKGPMPKLQAVKLEGYSHQNRSDTAELNSFDKAGELLKSGMSEEDVATRCELSSSETALMAMVMKKKTASI